MSDKKFELINKGGVAFLIVFLILVVVSYFKSGIYSSKLGMNIAVVGDGGIGILSLRPVEGIISWTDLPNKMNVNINGSSAIYPTESLWKYGELEKKTYVIVSRSLTDTTGVLISRVIRVSGKESVDQVLGQLHRLTLQTDLSLRDRLAIRAFLSNGGGQKKVFEYEVPKNSLNEATDPDGKTFLSINSGFYSWAKNKFPFDPILMENVDVIVNNLSTKQGAGFTFSKIIEIAGVRVVEVKSVESQEIPSRVGCYFVNLGKFALTEKLLEEQVGCKKLQSTILKNNTLPKNFSGIGIWLR